MSAVAQSDGRRRRRVSDARILAAAVSEFAEHGFTGASIARIAERARTTRPTLYSNFGSKEGLFAAAVRTEGEALRFTLMRTYERIGGEGVAEQVRAGTQAIFDFAAARPEGFRLLFGGNLGLPLSDPTLRAIYDEVIDAVAAMIESRFSGPSASRRAHEYAVMVVGLVNATARDTVEQHRDPAAAAEVASQFLLGAFSRVSRSSD